MTSGLSMACIPWEIRADATMVVVCQDSVVTGSMVTRLHSKDNEGLISVR